MPHKTAKEQPPDKLTDDRPFTLSEDEIIERLRTEDKDVIDEIHKTCLDLLYKEEERAKSTDSKGSSLIGIIGLSSSLIFTLGGILIEKISNVNLPIIGCPIPWLVLFYCFSSLTLLIAITLTFFAIKTREDWRWLKDEDIFHAEMIEGGINPYKRYMSTHIWKIFQNNFLMNEKKASCLKWAQQLFMFALAQLVPIIAIISLYVLEKGGFF